MSQREGFEASREARRATTAAGAARSARHEQWLAEAMAAAYYHELHGEKKAAAEHGEPAEAPVHEPAQPDGDPDA